MAKQISEAKILVDSLLAQGVKKSEIAKKLGIDSSTITQIERGKKPGRNLIEPLRAIAEKRAAIPPREIRKTKSGEVAKVRKGKKVSASTLKRDKLGRIKIAPVTSLPYVTERRLKELADAGAKVSVQILFDSIKLYQETMPRLNYVFTLYSRGGEYASRLARDFSFQRLKEVVESLPQVEWAGNVEGVGYLAIYTAAGGEA